MGAEWSPPPGGQRRYERTRVIAGVAAHGIYRILPPGRHQRPMQSAIRFPKRPGACRIALLAAVILTRGVGHLLAQCPDGTPPPCAVARPAATPRRVNPPLDDRAWIVLPFDNTTRAPDIDWLRDASVELLYLDLSRWHDIRVVDARRVADFMREVPASSGSAKLSLNDALAWPVVRGREPGNGRCAETGQSRQRHRYGVRGAQGRAAGAGIFRVAPPARARLGTLALWSKPDPEFNLIVERARKALAAFQPT